MATWLDVLSNNWQDPRGRVNPFSVARGFTSRGRQEIDQQQQIADMAREEAIQQVQRQRAMRSTMAGGVDPTTYQPRSMEEVAMVEGMLGPMVTRSNLETQGVNRDVGRFNVRQGETMLPIQAESGRLANQGEQQRQGYEQQLQPGRVQTQSLQNQGMQTANTFASQALPFQVGQLNLQNQGMAYDLNRRQQFDPELLKQVQLATRQGEESLVENLAGQTDRLRLLGTQADTATRMEQEGQATQPFRIRAAETASQVDPRVMQYVQSMPLMYSPEMKSEARGLLGMPPMENQGQGQGGVNQAVIDAINSVAQRSRYQMPSQQQQSPTSQPVSNGKNELLLPKVGQVIGGVYDKATRFFGHAPSTSEEQQIGQMLQTPEGRAQLERLYPRLSNEDKRKIQIAIRNVQGSGQ